MKVSLALRLVIVLAFVNIIQNAKPKQKTKCDERTRQRIDRLFAEVVPVINGAKLPENEKQLQRYCSSVSKAMESAIDYVKSCGGTFGPMISKMVSNEYNKEMNEICKSRDGKRVRDKLSAGRCVNSATAKLEKCANYAIDSMMALKSVPIKDRLNTGCCQSHKFLSCAMRALIKSKRCDKDLIERIEREVLVSLGDSCGPYFGDTQKCSRLLAKVPKLNESYVRPKSVFIPAISLMESFRNMKCTAQNEQTMDAMVAQMLTIGTPEKIPENSFQLNQWCNTAMHNMPYFYGYIESCLSDFGKFLAKVLSGAMATNFRPYCGPEAKNALDNPNPDMQEYINAAKCGNKAEDKIKACLDTFNENILAISEAPEMSRIRMACCNAYELRTCVFNSTISTKGCSLRTVQWAERQVMNNVEGAVNLVCADHWGGPKCQRLVPQMPRIDKTKYIAPKSPFFPMIKLLESFPDVDFDKN